MDSPRRRLPPDERREAIVAAASTVFATRPYEHVTASELAAACGVSRGLLSHYFPTRRQLHVAVLARLLGEPRFDGPSFPETASLEERIAIGVTGWVGMAARGRETWLTASRYLGSTLEDDLARIVDEYIDAMADQICEIVGLHDVRDHPVVRSALHGYSAYATSLTRRWLIVDDITRAQLEALLRGTLVTLVRTAIPGALAVPEGRTGTGRA
ncbi:TetR/AcrR family transcriptional regulator [Microbacterium ureisolvens]|uniref:TetR/AcrR family transcriptional regulator n=1 Tax=Microbacterium ureisolvens TaxID=2781186 RepID=UPI003624DA3C